MTARGAASTGVPCLDPVEDGLRRWREVESWIESTDLLVDALDDTDGDAVAEVLVATTTLCGATGNCPYAVYLSNGGCPSFAGTLDGVSLSPREHENHGVRDVETYWKMGCLAMAGVITIYRFDGREYRDIESVECACVWEDQLPAPDRDPRCPG